MSALLPWNHSTSVAHTSYERDLSVAVSASFSHKVNKLKIKSFLGFKIDMVIFQVVVFETYNMPGSELLSA